MEYEITLWEGYQDRHFKYDEVTRTFIPCDTECYAQVFQKIYNLGIWFL